jgi:hypothetical protein
MRDIDMGGHFTPVGQRHRKHIRARRVFKRRGRVQKPRRALVYVLMNIKKHSQIPCEGVDPCSSALWFDGFVPDRPPISSRDPPPVQPPRTWLAAHGWRRRGLIDPREYPRPLA